MRHDAAATHRSPSDIIRAISILIWRIRRWRSATGLRFAAWATATSGAARKTRAYNREQIMIISDLLTGQIMPLFGVGCRQLRTSSTPWASTSFAGHRHTLILTRDAPLDQTSERCLSAAIADKEFDLGGAIVADAHIARISPDGRTITVELLTVTC